MLSIGIDIGGTKIAVGLVDTDAGKILAQRSFATEAAAGFDRAVGRIIVAIDECLAEAKYSRSQLTGVGIGCAGPVDPRRGTIDNPNTLPTWDGVNIVTPLRREFDVPVVLENDADAAVVGEAFHGAGAGRRRIVMLTFGTGIGAGILVDGRIYRGAGEVHPELGHIPIDPAGPDCYCGSNGCFESLASGTAISQAGQAAGLGDARAVFAAAAVGDAKAIAIVDRALAAAATAVRTLQYTLVPERIILGGGIIDDHFAIFADAARRAIDGVTQNPAGITDVVAAKLGNRAGIVGAAMLAQCSHHAPRDEPHASRGA